MGSFVDLTGIRGDLTERSRKVRERILQWIGIPTCIGLGPTKTLAKLANHVAKTAERKPGVYPDHFAQICHLGRLNRSELDEVLAATAAGRLNPTSKFDGQRTDCNRLEADMREAPKQS